MKMEACEGCVGFGVGELEILSGKQAQIARQGFDLSDLFPDFFRPGVGVWIARRSGNVLLTLLSIAVVEPPYIEFKAALVLACGDESCRAAINRCPRFGVAIERAVERLKRCRMIEVKRGCSHPVSLAMPVQGIL